MKLILATLIFLCATRAVADDSRPPFYALDCSGDLLIGSLHHEWKKKGIEAISTPYDYSKWDFAQAALAWTSSISVSALLEQNLDHNGFPLEKGQGAIDWRKGIQFQTDSLGLPYEIDGCRVIPLVVYAPHSAGGRDFLYLANADDFFRLAGTDRVFVTLGAEGVSDALLGLLFSKSYLDTPLREKARLLGLNGVNSFRYDRPHVWGSYELRECEWWSDSIPKKCTTATSPWSAPLLWKESEVTFWPNGYVHTGELVTGDLPKSQNFNSPDSFEKVHGCGDFSYREDGSLERCL